MDQLIYSRKEDDADSNQFSIIGSAKAKSIKAYVGFESDELKNTTTSDLKQLKITILMYLNSTTQKYKNSEYDGLYKRLIKELRSRNVEVEKPKDGHTLLGKKKGFKESIFDINIPSFFNDLHSKKQGKHSKNEKINNIPCKKELKQKLIEEESQGESDTNESDKSNKSFSDVIKKKCIIKGK